MYVSDLLLTCNQHVDYLILCCWYTDLSTNFIFRDFSYFTFSEHRCWLAIFENCLLDISLEGQNQYYYLVVEFSAQHCVCHLLGLF